MLPSAHFVNSDTDFWIFVLSLIIEKINVDTNLCLWTRKHHQHINNIRNQAGKYKTKLLLSLTLFETAWPAAGREKKAHIIYGDGGGGGGGGGSGGNVN